MSTPGDSPQVLILGAGINGAAVARELVLGGVGVCLVDKADIATGATSRSSRLIHGGLRYLEYADFALVYESLRERARLLRNAPHFVRPLKLHIPVQHRTGGFLASGLRFLGAGTTRAGRWCLNRLAKHRGLWTVRLGLMFYDLLAGRGGLPRHTSQRVRPNRPPSVDSQKFRWLCSYWDGQIEYPERFVLAMLADAQRHAAEHGIPFSVHTYHQAHFDGSQAVIVPVHQASQQTVPASSASHEGAPHALFGEASGVSVDSLPEPIVTLRPAIVVNATGAWGDRTLQELPVESPRLFGGTKGSHFYTRHQPLRDAIGDDGIYAEAADGRLVFILPVTGGAWVGTTDERYEGDPGNAAATEREVEYLIALVNEVLAGVALNRSHVMMHCAGVRPLPYVPEGSAAAIPRGHDIAVNESGPVPVLTLIGGKLTTCRELGEEVARSVLQRLDRPFAEQTRDRPLPGAAASAGVPADRPRQLTAEQYNAVRALAGERWDEIFPDGIEPPLENLPGTALPLAFVRWVVAHEWVGRVSDLVERRLMLLYEPGLSRDCLAQLANCLVEAGKIPAYAATAQIDDALERLRTLYGREVE